MPGTEGDDASAPEEATPQALESNTSLSSEHKIHALELSPPSPLMSPSSSTHSELDQLSNQQHTSDENDHSEGADQQPLHPAASSPSQTRMSISADSCKSRPSNTTLLCTAFVSFMSFSLVQLFFAFLAGSEAMKGDSAAMIVDSLTYLFNWYAEKRKDRFDQFYTLDYDDVIMSMANNDPERAERVRIRERRKLVLKLEIIPPLISVTTLIAVTIVVLKEAIEVLVLDIKRNRSEQKDPNIHLMMAFSVFNLALDFLNVFCFARAKHLMGFETKEHNHHHHMAVSPVSGANGNQRSTYVQLHQELHNGGECDCDGEELHQQFHNGGECDCDGREGETAPNGGALEEEQDDEGEKANLNMCSAYTHVFADTLRSIAVILAALVAELTGVTSEEADSSAAIAVSVLILLSLVPLFQGLIESSCELNAIHKEELSESLFSGQDGGISTNGSALKPSSETETDSTNVV